ncbi:hypothetical protein AJ88_26830 [Mesorhizobium amorphae CCBAU 01583]|nr:hypothetical protein AJ88_26830 [Mesorhizobium amorphae CCBAU 01583]
MIPKIVCYAETSVGKGSCIKSGFTDLQFQVSQNLTESKTGQRVLTVTVRREKPMAAWPCCWR